MSKSRHLCPERDTAVAQRGPSENYVYMSKSRQLRRERAASAAGAWWLCSCPQGRIACSATFSGSPSTCAGFLFRCLALCAMLPLYPSHYHLRHSHLMVRWPGMLLPPPRHWDGPQKTTMWEFHWDILKQRYFSGAEFNNTTPTAAVRTVHGFASRLLCTHCRSGSMC